MKFLAVNYHYIREEKPERGIYPLSLKQLDDQVEELNKYFEFVGLNDLLDFQSLDQSKNYCLLTFDDGLKEQVQAFDFLRSKGIPALFFVSTDAVESHNPAAVHQLHYVRTQLNDEEMLEELKKSFPVDDYKFDDELLRTQYRYDNQAARQLKYYINFVLRPEQRKSFIDKVFDSLVSNKSAFCKKLYMNEDEIRKINQASCLGTHSASHLPLAGLDEQAMRKEISDSLDFLEKVTGERMKSISYPYGGPSAVNKKVAEVSKDYGLEIGLTMWRGLNTVENFDNPLLLNRVDTNDAPGGKKPDRSLIP